jgi:membrane-bound lytic murein transglycosylase A
MQERIRRNFAVFQAEGVSGANPDHDMLVTGYFQPVLDGSLVKKAPYLYPLYSVPPDLVIQPDPDSGNKRIGRIKSGRFTPYWTRQEIDTRGRAAGCELAWLKDPLDVFFLQVQGSGLIRLPDGTIREIHYAAKNGHPYRSIGRYMVQTGRIRLEDASMETIRSYINSHPDELQEILFTNPSYIFFNWAENSGARGNLGIELTPERSVAVDQKHFPAAGLAFLTTRQPVIRLGKIIAWKPVHRFVLVQDRGSAIRGPGRVDIFLGAGDEAGDVAGFMKEKGCLYFLLPKTVTP